MSINCFSKHHISRCLNGDFCWMFPNVCLKLTTLQARTLPPPSLSPRPRNSLLSPPPPPHPGFLRGHSGSHLGLKAGASAHAVRGSPVALR